jgi:tRNA A-37 threonylcarbamoyl transferase component Bud32
VAERDIFVAALEIGDPGRRRDYLAGACGSDTALRGRVEGLLHALDRAGDFLQSPADSASLLDRRPPEPVEVPGTVIGRYTLVEQIGEGGMGVVFVAEQRHPVRRRVALKAVKPGMDTRAVLDRFEAERQALALMEHPNIAKVFDAGSTDHGRPYFVMELVKGVSITEFCDGRRLTIRERLGLLTQVCAAVQHAHQKGVMHRDIKPSNVLVECHDGRPVPKVIDFGIAKATGGRLGDTMFMRVIGTPLYAGVTSVTAGILSVRLDSALGAVGAGNCRRGDASIRRLEFPQHEPGAWASRPQRHRRCQKAGPSIGGRISARRRNQTSPWVPDGARRQGSWNLVLGVPAMPQWAGGFKQTMANALAGRYSGDQPKSQNRNRP